MDSTSSTLLITCIQNCRWEFVDMQEGVHTGVKRSWNCRWEFVWKSRVLGVGAKVHMGIQGLKSGGKSPCRGQKVSKLQMGVCTRVERSWNCKWEFVWELKGPRIASGSPFAFLGPSTLAWTLAFTLRTFNSCGVTMSKFWINWLGKWFWKVLRVAYHFIHTLGTHDFRSHSRDFRLLHKPLQNIT